MRNYQSLLEDILMNGVDKDDRTGVGTRSVFGRQLRWDLSKGFPLVTTKKVGIRLILSELLWFLKGDTSLQYLLQHNNNIWNEWAFEKWVRSDEYDGPDMADFGLRVLSDEDFKQQYEEQLAIFKKRVVEDEAFAKRFDLGPVYGKQWRSWETRDGKTIDQIAKVVEDLKKNPNSRRHIVNAWNVGELDEMALVPCHYSFQFYVANGKLSCMWNQRSVDSFLGLPFNIASYAFLTHMVAEQCDLEVGELVFNGGDVHLYRNHIEQAQLQISRTPYDLPTLKVKRKPESIFDYEMDDFEIVNYKAHPHIKAEVAV